MPLLGCRQLGRRCLRRHLSAPELVRRAFTSSELAVRGQSLCLPGPVQGHPSIHLLPDTPHSRSGLVPGVQRITRTPYFGRRTYLPSNPLYPALPFDLSLKLEADEFPSVPRSHEGIGDHAEYDVLFLRQHGVKHAKWHLTEPLRHGARVKLSYGASLPASDLIGRQLLDRVFDNAGNAVVLHEPTLATYIVNSERLATPIYPHDATTIVSLLDLNPSRPQEEEQDDDHSAAAPFEIFEAGTGMGSLTLHIARALHAANPPLPPTLRHALLSASFKPNYDFSSSRACLAIPPETQALFDAYYASSRRAVLHTLDRNAKHARAAYRIVRNFRRAQYLPTVDFHVGSVEDYITQRLQESQGRPFLSRAVLDLPSAHDNADKVVQALLPNGLLVVFNPSISQIADFQGWMSRTAQPLRLEKVIELATTTVSEGGVHDSAGGRQWDVKTVIPRAQDGGEDGIQPVQVMRPKVGERVAGGGFVAVMRRWPASTSTKSSKLPEPIEEESTQESPGELEPREFPESQ